MHRHLIEEDPDEISTRKELGAALTRLRQTAGLSLRDVARHVDSSASTIGDWCRGDRLPFPANEPTFHQMLVQFGVDPEPWLRALRRVRDELPTASSAGPSPYPGLAGFGSSDRQFFHGRESLIASIVQELESAGRLAIVGASGSGKSSLVRAGVLPRIEETWSSDTVVITPGQAPISSLIEGLALSNDDSERQFLERLLRETRSLSTVLEARQDLGAAGQTFSASAIDDANSESGLAPPSARRPQLVVMVDQLEELFSSETPDDERELLLDALTEAKPRLEDDCPNSGFGHVVVFVLRVDFYPAAMRHAGLASVLEQNQVLVGPLSRTELKQAIVQPARQAGVAVEDDLLHVLLNDFVPVGSGGVHDAGTLPLLAHALRETWDLSRRGTMTLADYRTTGGVAGAIGTSAEHVYTALDPGQQVHARQVFMRLVQVHDQGPTTRRLVRWPELPYPAMASTGAGQRPLPESVARFVEARLLTVDRRGVQITHEALLDAWPRLREWVVDAVDDLREQRRLVQAVRAWDDGGRSATDLARGSTLASMARLRQAGTDLQLSSAERSFLDQSLAAREQRKAEERGRLRRLRMLVAALAVVTLIAAGLAVVARTAQQAAVGARDNALSRQVAVTAASVRETDPTVAAQMSLASFHIAGTLEARSSLLDAGIQPMATRLMGGAGQTAMAQDGQRLLAVGDSSSSAVQLYIDGPDWQSAGRVQLDEDTEVWSIALAGDEAQTLALGLHDGTIRLWDVQDPTSPLDLNVTLPGGLSQIPQDEVSDNSTSGLHDLEVTEQGRQLVASGNGVTRWDVSNPTSPVALLGMPSVDVVNDTDHAPDGSWLAVARASGVVEIWSTGDEPGLLSSANVSDTDVFGVAIHPSGNRMAAALRDGRVVLLDVARTGRKLRPSETALVDASFDSWVNTVTYSQDGTWLAAGTSALETRVWDVELGKVVQRLGSPSPVVELHSQPNGSLLSVANDGGVYTWGQTVTQPATVPGRVFGMSYTRDGATLASFSSEDTSLWDVSDDGGVVLKERIAQLPEDLTFASTGDISEDGRWLAISTYTGFVVVMDLQDRGWGPTVLGQAGGLAEQARFSPDGAWLTSSEGPNTTAWSMADVERIGSEADAIEFGGDQGNVVKHAWSPDGQLLALGSFDGSTYLFAMENGMFQRLATLTSRAPDSVTGVDFHPGGDIVATADVGGLTTIWDVSDPEAPVVLGEHADPGRRIYDVAFSPKGDLLASAATEGTVGLLDMEDPSAPSPVALLEAGDAALYATAMAPSGTTVTGAGTDGWIRVWPLNTSQAAERICNERGEPMTEEAWLAAIPGSPWTDPC